MKAYCVRATSCHHTAGDEEVYRALTRAVAPLERTWSRLAAAKRIAIKFNHDWAPDRVVMRHGHRQQLISDTVARATLRLLRERTTAELVAVDVGVEGGGFSRMECAQLLPIFQEFDVEYVDGTSAPIRWAEVPAGGLLFDRYPLPVAAVDADETVSVQKVKNHRFAGVTLSLKNLFGLSALAPAGRPRQYFHHLVRLPYVLADLGRILNPALNILDGIVCQAGEEWGPGDEPRDSGTIVAGDHCVATDAYATSLMGHDPAADWRTAPFHRDRNALLVAADAGFGTVDLSEIDAASEVEAPIGDFFAHRYDAPQTIQNWARTTAEQALFYRENRERFLSAHARSYILLHRGEVVYASADGSITRSRREIAGGHPEDAMWMKFVDPDEYEGEQFAVYERAYARTAG